MLLDRKNWSALQRLVREADREEVQGWIEGVEGTWPGRAHVAVDDELPTHRAAAGRGAASAGGPATRGGQEGCGAREQGHERAMSPGQSRRKVGRCPAPSRFSHLRTTPMVFDIPSRNTLMHRRAVKLASPLDCPDRLRVAGAGKGSRVVMATPRRRPRLAPRRCANLAPHAPGAASPGA